MKKRENFGPVERAADRQLDATGRRIHDCIKACEEYADALELASRLEIVLTVPKTVQYFRDLSWAMTNGKAPPSPPCTACTKASE